MAAPGPVVGRAADGAFRFARCGAQALETKPVLEVERVPIAGRISLGYFRGSCEVVPIATDAEGGILVFTFQARNFDGDTPITSASLCSEAHSHILLSPRPALCCD